jgi:glycine/D-amino acid oxidase-like deaminating enzyme
MKKRIHSDVVVLGGGAAGVAAAVASARAGLRVSLIDGNTFLGGSATSSEVGTICGLFNFNKDQPVEIIASRFATEFAQDLAQRSATTSLCDVHGLRYLPYQVSAFRQLCLERLHQEKVDLHLQSALHAVRSSAQQIEQVTTITDRGSVEFRCLSVVDCSGLSQISQLAELPLIPSDKYQAAAQVFTISDLGKTDEATLGLVLRKELGVAVATQILPSYFDRVYIVPGSLRMHRVSLKIAIPLAVTHTQENLAELKALATRLVQELTDYLIAHVALFKTAKLSHIAPKVGIRDGARAIGRYILTEHDVLSGSKFSDSVANSSWPIEEWGQDRRVQMRYLPKGEYYQIPARCLQSAAMENLFMAGKCISATDAAIASARVIGTCLQTGYAAGHLAAAQALGLATENAVQYIQTSEFGPFARSLC